MPNGPNGASACSFEPDPAYPLAPFHPEAVNGLIGSVRWEEDGALEVGFIPVWSEPPGRPILPSAEMCREIASYIDTIGRLAGLPPLLAEIRGSKVTLRA